MALETADLRLRELGPDDAWRTTVLLVAEPGGRPAGRAPLRPALLTKAREPR